jgi:pyruvate-ferredoxin/flavodoxin oxidoreductase
MIPNMYTDLGELLPGVFHVSARSLASHALSSSATIRRDGLPQTGFGLLCSIQRAGDSRPGCGWPTWPRSGPRPFVHFFDGFRTSHEIQKIEVWI